MALDPPHTGAGCWIFNGFPPVVFWRGVYPRFFFAALRRSFAELGMEFRPDIACCTPLVLKPYFPRA